MKTAFFLNLFFLFLIAPAHYATSQDEQKLTAEACCSAIIVRDLEQALKWYSEALHFETETEFRNEERGIAIANIKLGSTRLELIETRNSLNPDSLSATPVRIQGFFKFGLRVTSLDTWLDHLSSFVPDITNKVVNDPLSGKRMVVIRDPEGNRIQIFED